MKKEKIKVIISGKVAININRVVEHQGQYIGPFYCQYMGKRTEVKLDDKGDFIIEG